MTSKISLDSFVKRKAIPLLSIDTAFALTMEYIEEILSATPRDIREITSHLAGAMGKGIRAKLMLLCSMDSECVVPIDAIGAAAGVELLHLATLVHDDVIDDSPLRRGIPTAQSRFGKKRAVITGDYILCLAAEQIMAVAQKHTDDKQLVDLMPEFMAAMKNICLGEHSQNLNQGNLELDFRQYIKIINGKTAALFYLSAYAGALLCREMPVDTHEKQIRSLAGFGRYLGIIFQIIDDCKDYEFTETDALKPVSHDIMTGVITLPLIVSMSKSSAVRDVAVSIFKDSTSPENLVSLVKKNGGVGEAKNIANRYFQKAESLLQKAALPEMKHNALSEVLGRAAASSKVF